MKKVLFILVSLLLTGAAYATNAGKQVVNKISNKNEISVKQQDQPLILEQTTDWRFDLNDHYSHMSHASHASHASHFSHYSSSLS